MRFLLHFFCFLGLLGQIWLPQTLGAGVAEKRCEMACCQWMEAAGDAGCHCLDGQDVPSAPTPALPAPEKSGLGQVVWIPVWNEGVSIQRAPGELTLLRVREFRQGPEAAHVRLPVLFCSFLT
ncbi:MAG: hypothetical protein KDK97_09870 [Verrucomicrobiales bacterium]|nr:hypothetical protein [Verrucomicrobiales bacterium]MCP5560258.1 hypothetical protein [Verrucomicrobiaceae bacterium]